MDDDSVRTAEQGAAPVQGGPADQVESLDDLALEGRRLHEGATAAPGEPGAAATVVDQPPTEADIVDMLVMVREMAAPAAEDAGILSAAKVSEIWNEAALGRIAKPLLAIMQRRGLTFGEAFDKWGPYAMLLAGIVGPAIATWRAIRAHQSAAHAAAQ